MKTAAKKLIIAIALCLAATTLFSSCSLFTVNDYFTGDTLTNAKTEPLVTRPVTYPERPVASEKDEYVFDPVSRLEILQSRNYDGEYFNIVTFGDEKLFFTSEDDYYSKHSYEIRKAIELKFSIALAEKAVTSETVVDYITGERESGGYYADLLILPYGMMKTLRENGFIASFENKAFYDPDFPYFDKEIVNAMRGEDELTYAIYSPAFYEPRESYCIFFNKKAADAQSLYADVFSQDWTFDSFYQAVKGKKVVYDEGFSGFMSIIDAEGAQYTPSGDPVSVFSEGSADFMITRVSDIEKLAGMSDAFGILPLPKFSADGDYYSYCASMDDLPVFMCPDSPTSYETTMIILNAISAATGDVYSHYTEERLVDYVRDNASVYILQYIFSPMIILDELPDNEAGDTGAPEIVDREIE